jgi:hypothetical protein
VRAAGAAPTMTGSLGAVTTLAGARAVHAPPAVRVRLPAGSGGAPFSYGGVQAAAHGALARLAEDVLGHYSVGPE